MTMTLRPDTKGRISLGKYAKNVSSFILEVSPDGTLLLAPQVEIPAREAWLYQNKDALRSLKKGMGEASKGELKNLGSFAAHADESL